MKLWLLRPNGTHPNEDEGDRDIIRSDRDLLWRDEYDMVWGFVVRAETEEQARAIAQANAGDESDAPPWPAPAWLSDEHSTCVELTAEGDAGVVIRDYRAR